MRQFAALRSFASNYSCGSMATIEESCHLPLLNKALLPSSLSSIVLHGALVAGFAFNIGSQLSQDKGNVRLNIQLNSINIQSEPVQESVSAPPSHEAIPEENQVEEVEKPVPEPIVESVVSSSKSTKEKVAKAQEQPEPVKPEPVREASPEPETSSPEVTAPADTPEVPQADSAAQASAAMSESANTVDPIKVWLAELQQRIIKYRRYPKQAQRRGREGDVQIKAVINIDGSLASAEVLSGHRSFHNDSLRSLRKALPFPPPKGTRQPVTMVFTIHYELE